MKAIHRAAITLGLISSLLVLAGCANPPGTEASAYDHDTPMTGSHIAHGPRSVGDSIGSTTYVPTGVPGGNGLPATRQ